MGGPSLLKSCTYLFKNWYKFCNWHELRIKQIKRRFCLLIFHAVLHVYMRLTLSSPLRVKPMHTRMKLVKYSWKPSINLKIYKADINVGEGYFLSIFVIIRVFYVLKLTNFFFWIQDFGLGESINKRPSEATFFRGSNLNFMHKVPQF